MTSSRHRPRKRFGQHFLHDRNAISGLIEALEPVPGDRIIEIGPGRGALTGPLLESVPALEAVEIDRDLAQDLRERYAGSGKLTVHCADALKFDFCGAGSTPVRVIGNLPYNISTPLLFHLLDQPDCISLMVLMLQKEVARRICAGPGRKEYGRLSVMVQSCCEVELLFTIGRGAFTPPPKVDSAVIRMHPAREAAAAVADRRQFAHLVRTAFNRRRKTLRNSLRGLANADDLEAAGVSPGARPEELSVEDFLRLARRLHDTAPARGKR